MRFALVPAILLLTVPTLPVAAQPTTDSVEAQLCRSQLELLMARQKLTPEEEAVYAAQCDCLDSQAKSGDRDRQACAQPHQ